jgi:hypothetical protein
VSTSDSKVPGRETYDVGVAIVPFAHDLGDQRNASQSADADTIPGYEDVSGRGRHSPDRRPLLIERGEQAVRAATGAIAAQIGLTANRIATEIGEQLVSPSPTAELELESINVSFGVTLTAGVQAMFTAQADSSVQVSITLVPRRGTSASAKS